MIRNQFFVIFFLFIGFGFILWFYVIDQKIIEFADDQCMMTTNPMVRIKQSSFMINTAKLTTVDALIYHDSKDITCIGNTELQWNGLFVHGIDFYYHNKNQEIESQQPVFMKFNTVKTTAESMHLDLRKKRITLVGKVHTVFMGVNGEI